MAQPLTNQQIAEQTLNDINTTLTPYATVYTSTDNLGSYNKQTIYKNPTSSESDVNKFTDWFKSVGTGTLNLIGDIAKEAWNSAISALQDVPSFVNDISKEFSLSNKIDSNNKQLSLLQNQMSSLSSQYRSGQISKEDYVSNLSTISKQINDIAKDSTNVTKQAIKNQTATPTDAINSAVDIITVVTSVLPETKVFTTLTILSKDGAEAAKMINILGKSVKVSDAVFNNASKIDNAIKIAADSINKISTFGGKFKSGTLVRMTQSVIENSAAKLTAKQIAKNIAIGWILKRPLVYQTDVDIVKDIYQEIIDGDVGGTALSVAATAAMALSGGPIGYGLEMLRKSGKYLKLAYQSAKNGFANDSFIDALSSGIYKGETKAGAQHLAKILEKEGKNSEYLKKVAAMEAINMKMAGGDAKKAASLVLDYYNSLDDGKFLKGNVIEKVFDDMVNHQTATDIVKEAAKRAGWTENEINRVVAGRMGSSDKELIGAILKEADKYVDKTSANSAEKLNEVRKQLLAQAIDRYGRIAAWANNDELLRQIETIIDNNSNTEDMIKAINKIKVGKTVGKELKLTKAEAKKLNDLGYTAVLPKHTVTPNIRTSDIAEAKFKTSFTDGSTIFEQAVKPIHIMNTIVSMMSKVGISPVEAQQEVYDTFRNNFKSYMETAIRKGEIKIAGNSDTVMIKLYDSIRKYNASKGVVLPITDLRQMSSREIMEALNVSKKEAKIIMGSLNSAMLSIPKEIRGIGDKIQDLNMAYNPLQAKYSRTQGAFRFNYNPFFKLQQAYQTEMFAQLELGSVKMIQLPGLNKVNEFLFKDRVNLYEGVEKKLEELSIFGEGYSGQGSTGEVIGKVGTRLTRSERRSLSGMIAEQARKAGYGDTLSSIERYIDENYDNVIDTMQTITISGGKAAKTVFDSPLGRTINTIFFPFRFNMKTANLIAKYLSKLNAPTQVALITTAYHADQWLQSDEGIAWQQKYSDAIKLFNWISPTYPLTYVMQIGKDLIDPKNASIGDLGLLGGLPFGFISQMLQSNGVIESSAPYVDPKTGEVYAKYVPDSMKAEVNLAIQDFLGSLFTYPGTIIGLPGKSTMIREATTSLVGGNEFTAVSQEGNLTPEQQKYSQVLKQLTAEQPITATGTNATTLTAPKSTATTIKAKSSSEIPITVKPTSSSTKKKKKSEFIARAPQ